MLKSLVTEPWEENYVYAKDYKMLPQIKDVLLRVDQSCKVRIDPDPVIPNPHRNTRSHHSVVNFARPPVAAFAWNIWGARRHVERCAHAYDGDLRADPGAPGPSLEPPLSPANPLFVKCN